MVDKLKLRVFEMTMQLIIAIITIITQPPLPLLAIPLVPRPAPH